MPRRARKPTHSFIDAARGERIQKVIADAGLASRRHAEVMIAEGLVKVNGELIDALPAWVDPTKDRITVDGKALRAPQRHIYVMLHKPTGFVCTNSDPEGRRLATELVEHPSHARLYPVGRLDLDSSGLLLLTNDGEFANRLTHPRYEVHKEYEVLVKGALDPADVARLEEGIFLPSDSSPGSRTRSTHLRILRRDGDRTLLTMELREGRNRQIRRMMADMGHPVKRLRRIRMGPLRLRGLAIGAWRDLTHTELSQLRKEAFADAATIQKRRSAPRRTGARVRARAK
ncbi:MAG: rRNA pseudouridine synthase [Phycisphaerales bacterium]|nr:rRNA pseudouridine synthase [Phycisphaerales bacterium]